MKTTFSIKRTGLLMKLEILNNWKRHTARFAGIFLVAFLILTTTQLFCSETNLDKELKLYRFTGAAFCSSLFILGGLFSVGTCFSQLKTKQLRIQHLMLPATQLEKYAALTTTACISFLLGFTVAVTLADLTCIILFSMPSIEEASVWPDLWRNLTESVRETVNLLQQEEIDKSTVLASSWRMHAVFLFMLTSYLLGAAAFRRKAFLKTSTALFVFILTIGVVTGNNSPGNWLLTTINGNDAIMALLFTLLSIGNIWGSYHLFKRIEVIPSKTI